MSARKAPDFAEPIVAWRAWMFGGEARPLLRSQGRDPAWPAGRAKAAVCLAIPDGWARSREERHRAPERSCTCGIYAVQTQEQALVVAASWHGRYPFHPPHFDERLTGRVHLWGRVVEHEQGYRAEYAYPKLVIVPSSFRSFLIDERRRRISRLSAAQAAALIGEMYGAETLVR